MRGHKKRVQEEVEENEERVVTNVQIEIKDTSKVLKSKWIKIHNVLTYRSEGGKQLNKRRTKYVNNYLLKSMKYLTAINGAHCGPLALNFNGWKTKLNQT